MSLIDPTAPKSQLACILVALAILSVLLFGVFSFLAEVEVGEATGIALFLIAATLLIVGYMIALIFLALAGFSWLTARRAEQVSERGAR